MVLYFSSWMLLFFSNQTTRTSQHYIYSKNISLVVSYLVGFRWMGLTYLHKTAQLLVCDKLLQGASTIINCTSEALGRSLHTSYNSTVKSSSRSQIDGVFLDHLLIALKRLLYSKPRMPVCAQKEEMCEFLCWVMYRFKRSWPCAHTCTDVHANCWG